MHLSEALTVLGVTPDAEWTTVRRSYRSQLRTHHPDLTSDPNASTATARLVEAFGVVSAATDRGTTALADAVTAAEAANDALLPAVPVVLYTEGDVYTRLRWAMEEIGDISYANRVDRLVQATIDLPGTATSHLTAEVIDEQGQICVLFTLDPLTNGEPPQLASVVASLSRHLA